MIDKSSFFDAISSIDIETHPYKYRFPFDHRTDKLALSYFSTMYIAAPWGVVGRANFKVGGQTFWVSSANTEYFIELGVRGGELEGIFDCVLSNDTLSSPLTILFVPLDSTPLLSYVFDGIDHGAHILQMRYSEFYSIDGYFSDNKSWDEYFDFSAIKDIEYPDRSGYEVDVVANGELVANMNGVSSADGIEALGAGVHIRVRYKNVDNPYFGPLDITFRFAQGTSTAPKMEVVKNVE